MSSGGAGKGAPAVPAAARKVVMSLKEIVNCPEHEIYAMLKECNMDPSEAVNRLLSQGSCSWFPAFDLFFVCFDFFFY